MAVHHQPGLSPGGLHLSHHGIHAAHPQVNGHMPAQGHHKITPAHLSSLNESVWLGMGTVLPAVGIATRTDVPAREHL